jgi:hypothetical protein
MADNIGQRPTQVTWNQVVEARDRWRKAADHQIRIEEDRRDLSTLEQVLQIAVLAVKFINFAGQLSVDGLQLLVDGLNLFLRGFQFFVSGLQFFVDGMQFLVCAPQFLQRGVVLFRDGL